MMPVLRLIKQEPVLFQALMQASLALMVGFNLIKISDEQFGLLMAFTAALLGFFTRTAVTPESNPRTSDGKKLVRAGS